MIFDDIIERSEVSLTVLRKHAETDQTLANRVTEMENAGFLKIDFQKLTNYIIELTTDENGKKIKIFDEKFRKKNRKIPKKIIQLK